MGKGTIMQISKWDTIDDYISGFPVEAKAQLRLLRRLIHDAAPDAEEKIVYQMPTFYFHGNLVHFAAYKSHIGFYPAPSAIAAFRDELSAYKGAKGSVRFPINEPLPCDLIARIVAFRFRENCNNWNEKNTKECAER